MNIHEELQQLQTETTALRNENQQLRDDVHRLTEQRNTALRRIAELESSHTAPPARQPLIKANRAKPSEPDPPRRKRAAQYNRARRRTPPTRTVLHRLTTCPDCTRPLTKERVVYRRQVNDLPPPPAVEVIEHVVLEGWCPRCHAWQRAPKPLAGQVVGHSRLGVRLLSTIATLRTVFRLPVDQVQHYVRMFHHLPLSAGGISTSLQQVHTAATPLLSALKAAALASPVLHGEETGWRESGRSGYVWCFSTPGAQSVRYYEYDSSRAGAVVQRILNGQFAGHLVSDFYGGYNIYPGKHQRCWVHLLRDLHDLKAAHPADTAVQAWATAVRALYDTAHSCVSGADPPSHVQRETEYVRLVGQAHDLGQQYAQAGDQPCHALAQRILRHEDELFQCVLVAGVPADNNHAERSLRPLVIARKMSGGTRSEAGSRTRMAVQSLVATWHARGVHPLCECVNLLNSPTSSK